MKKSALDSVRESSYWTEASTGCVLTNRKSETTVVECNASVVKFDELLVDSGCDMTTVPETEAYRKYVTKGPLGPKVTIHLAGKKQVLSASEPYLVVLPV